jgi:DNA adenine methylase
MIVPQPFQYQGSKRALASVILKYIPAKTARLVEPFAGSAAMAISCAARGVAQAFWLNDCNKPLAELLGAIVNAPERVADAYERTWCGDADEAVERFYRVREDFNRSHDPALLLYLLARCVKGSVRYNSEGLFNQSPDKRRLGTVPSTMRNNLIAVSLLMRGKTIVTATDYRDVLANVSGDDVVYMDPPYQGVCGERDARYYSGIESGDFVVALQELNDRNVQFLISYDGRLGDKAYGSPLPEWLDLTRVEIEAGRSTQATFLGRDEVTFESLYLSKSLANRMNAVPCTHFRKDSSYVY